MVELTQERKLELLRAGQFVCQVPGVCTGYWNDADWITWVDQRGSWIVDRDKPNPGGRA